jgi:prevent-host-death family protein
MKIAPVADVKARLSAYLEKVAREGPVVITKNGHAVALLLVPLNDEDLERLLLTHSKKFQKILQRSRQSLAHGKGLSHTEFWQAVAQKNAA